MGEGYCNVRITCRAGAFSGISTYSTTIGMLCDRMREDAGLAGLDFKMYRGGQFLNPDLTLGQILPRPIASDLSGVHYDFKLEVDGE